MPKVPLKRKAIARTRRILNQVGIRKARKVFAIGFNKSGTSSLHALFLTLGLPSYHGQNWVNCEDLNLLRTYDCFSDDYPGNFQKLDYLFPNSKYILQVRDLGGWIYSRLAHIDREKRNNPQKVFPPTWDATEQAVKMWIKQRNIHHQFVLSYFSNRPTDLLTINYIKDKNAATKICRFLGYRGRYERPKKNVNPAKKHPVEHTDMLRKCLADLKIHENDLNYDILCPSIMENDSASQFPVDTSELAGTTFSIQ